MNVAAAAASMGLVISVLTSAYQVTRQRRATRQYQRVEMRHAARYRAKLRRDRSQHVDG